MLYCCPLSAPLPSKPCCWRLGEISAHFAVLVCLCVGYPVDNQRLVAAKHQGWIFWKSPITWHPLHFSSFIPTTQQQGPLASGTSDWGPSFKRGTVHIWRRCPFSCHSPCLGHTYSAPLETLLIFSDSDYHLPSSQWFWKWLLSLDSGMLFELSSFTVGLASFKLGLFCEILIALEWPGPMYTVDDLLTS